MKVFLMWIATFLFLCGISCAAPIPQDTFDALNSPDGHNGRTGIDQTPRASDATDPGALATLAFASEAVQTLTKIKEVDITPPGRSGRRPDAISIGGNLYIAYKDKVTELFTLIPLDKNLNMIGPPVDLFSDTEGGKRPTDIRVARDDRGMLWYAFESAQIRDRLPDKCDSNFLNAAMYSVAGGSAKVVGARTALAYGCPTGRGAGERFMRAGVVNLEAVDDPAPFFHNGRYYILTRSGLGNLQRIRSFDRSFNQLEELTLDLSPYLGSRNFSQSSLVDIDGQIYLIGSADNGPPMMRDSTARVYAIPLSHDLKSVSGRLILLTDRLDEYPTYVVSAVSFRQRLHITYLDRWHENTVAYLEVFDTVDGFRSLGRIRIASGIPDNHVTVQILDNKIYVFHQNNIGGITAQVFAWTKADAS